MRPLNRPMFKNGGPIKEGIMDGMKEPQALNTVGSPFAPRDASGRQGYALQFAPFIYAAGRAMLRPLGKFVTRQFAGPVKQTLTGKGGQKLLTSSKPIKGGFQAEKFDPNVVGKYLMQSPEGRFIMGASGKAGAAGKKVMGVTKSLAKSPLTVGSVLYYGGGALLPDGTPDPEDPKNYKPVGEGGKSGAPGGGDPGMYLTPKQSKADADKIAKDRIEANRKRYYELMGLDKAKKDDVYRGLIDASNIIQEEGADLKGSIKSGTLQNRIISALSKQLDKSADLKKQIDAAILKAEITKDINKDDPTKAADLAYKKAATRRIEKDLAGGSLIENINQGKKDSGGANSTNNVYNSVIKTYGTEPEVLFDTAEMVKIRKEGDYTNDADFVKRAVEAQQKGPGIYIVDKSVILIDENGNAQTLALG